MGVFKNKQIMIRAFRVPEEVTVNYVPPLVIPKNWWLCRFDDGSLEGWANDDFRDEFEPVDQAAKEALA